MALVDSALGTVPLDAREQDFREYLRGIDALDRLLCQVLLRCLDEHRLALSLRQVKDLRRRQLGY